MIQARYFRQRRPAQASDFEGAYWHVVHDPDGRERNRLEEREQYLADVAEELAVVRSLPPGRVLDVGCGLGFFLSALDGWDRHGVEISAFAAEHASRSGEIHVGTLESAAYPRGAFDLVVTHHVIEHVADPSAFIREISRVLAPGGRLILGTPDFDSGCARRFGDNYRLLHDDTHISLFDADGMHRFLRDHSFVIERVSYPFFGTRHFTLDNLARLFDTTRVSPPFYGNFMTFYCRKPRLAALVAALGAVTPAEAARAEREGARALAWLSSLASGSEPVGVVCESPTFGAHVASVLGRHLGPERVRHSESHSGTPLLILEPLPEVPGRALLVGDCRSNGPGISLSVPERAGVSRRAAQLLVLEALLTDFASTA